VTPGWLRIPQLPLAVLAGLTPRRHEVVTIEEECEPLPRDDGWDVVGISAMTATIGRAYEIADRARRAGSKVVLGGIHPSVLPEEAAPHADAVVVGEAEGVWPRVLEDVACGKLERVYHNPHPDLSNPALPVRKPQRSLFGLPPYVMPIVASRGCPNDCEFCCVHEVYGRRQRHLPVEHIVEDIRRSGARRLMFLDDNIGGERSYAMRLFQAIEPLRVKWSGQVTARFVLDDELFHAAVRAGLEGAFVGVESVEPEALASIRKSLASVAEYERAARRCRSAGVLFHASLIFGLDEQTPRVFERTLDFLLRNAVPSVSSNMLTPYPGTRLFARLQREGRLLHTEWGYYDHNTVCHRPRGMDAEELAERYLGFRRDLFSCWSILRRAWAQLGVAPLVYLGMNIAYRGTTRELEEHYRRYFRWLRARETPVRAGEAPAPRRAPRRSPRRPRGARRARRGRPPRL
jgi:radical SAM superfamily enzyme YgiQ (UPF0313 family)